MIEWSSAGASALASFLASAVECVEALTIVLAVGLSRGWRSALAGAGVGLVALLAMVAVLGPGLARLPLGVAQLAIGALLLLFGMRWLRKAILRSAGVVARHDEGQAFAEETAALRKLGTAPGQLLDRLAMASTFKIVLLEGLEVVFIVLAMGAGGQGLLGPALGAVLALFVVAALGAWLHRPLAQVPQNTLKFGVGVMLSAFGTFWVAQGLQLPQPGGEWALVGLTLVYLLVALALVKACAHGHARHDRLSRHGRRASQEQTPADAPSLAARAHGAWDSWASWGTCGTWASWAARSAWRKALLGLFVDDAGLAVACLFGMALAWWLQSWAWAGVLLALVQALALGTSALRGACR